MKNPTVNYREIIGAQSDEANNGLNVHNHLKDRTVEQLREIQDAARNPFAVAALNVTGDMNIGTIVRNACLAGAQAVYIIGRRRYDKRGTVGAQNYIDVHRLDALEDDKITISPKAFVEIMRENNMRPIFVEQGGKSVGSFSWKEMFSTPNDLDTIPCLVMGNENSGISDEILATQGLFRGSFVVSLPQKGVIRSLNVGAASAAIIWNMCLEMEWL